jgi:hypothetical protein
MLRTPAFGLLFSIAIGQLFASTLPEIAAAQTDMIMAGSTAAVARRDNAIAAAKLIADRLGAVNAAGLKSVASDPDFRSAVSDLSDYIRAAGAAGLTTLKLTHDPQLAIMAAYLAGEYTDKKGLILGLKSSPGRTLSDYAVSKIADAIVKHTGGTGVPTIGWDAARVGARFIMAYESGVIDSIAPNGLRPLLEKNTTTRKWLNNVDTALRASPAAPTSHARVLGPAATRSVSASHIVPIGTLHNSARGIKLDVAPTGQTEDLSGVRQEVLRLRRPGS